MRVKFFHTLDNCLLPGKQLMPFAVTDAWCKKMPGSYKSKTVKKQWTASVKAVLAHVDCPPEVGLPLPQLRPSRVATAHTATKPVRRRVITSRRTIPCTRASGSQKGTSGSGGA